MCLNSLIVKNLAKEVGFDSCGVSDISIDNNYYSLFENWLNNGYHADMHYLNKNINIRKNPELLVENAKSVISVLLNYYSNEKLNDTSITISKYSYGKDYHKVLKDKLYLLLKKIQEINPQINGRVFVDSAPVFERYFAWKAGLGFIGKNNCLINENFGSWVFIGEIIIDTELDYDNPKNDNCGKCRICIESCPSGALTENCLNANKCISYHTIENKREIPINIRNAITTQIFGCDICQNVCPFNHNVSCHENIDLNILPQIKEMNWNKINSLNELEYKNLYSETSFSRITIQKLLDNFKKSY